MSARKRGAASPNAKISSFARSLLADWRKLRLPTSDEPIIVAVSGGADSTALFLALDELKRSGKIAGQLVIAHLDHGIRPNSKRDARWVSSLAKSLGYSAVISRAKVREIAEAAQVSTLAPWATSAIHHPPRAISARKEYA